MFIQLKGIKIKDTRQQPQLKKAAQKEDNFRILRSNHSAKTIFKPLGPFQQLPKIPEITTLNDNFRKLGTDFSAKTIFKSLKNQPETKPNFIKTSICNGSQ